MKKAYLKKGDIIEVPLPSQRKGFIQYVYPDWWGDLIGVYDYIIDIDKSVPLEILSQLTFKHYPILTRIKQGMKFSEQLSHLDKLRQAKFKISDTFLEMAMDKSTNYNWKIVGNLAIDNFIYPKFIWKDGGHLTKNRVTKWYLFDGKKILNWVNDYQMSINIWNIKRIFLQM